MKSQILLVILTSIFCSCVKPKSSLDASTNYWKNKTGKALSQFNCNVDLNPIVKERKIRYIDPLSSQIRYTQNSIAPIFKNGKSVDKTAEELLNSPQLREQFTPIRIFKYLDKDTGSKPVYFTLDNRRLYVFKKARQMQIEKELTGEEIKIKVTLASKNEAKRDLKFKWTTTNFGTDIEVRK